MADIIAKIAAIRAAIFGKDVRENIASGIESINAEVINTTTRQGTVEGKQATLETTFNGLVINAGSSNAEIVAARNGEVSLPVRLAKVDTQLADMAINVKNFGAKGDGVTDDTQAFKNSLIFASWKCGNVFVPPSDKGYLLSGDNINIPEGVTLYGVSNGHNGVWTGKVAGSTLLITGNATLENGNPVFIMNMGSEFKGLSIVYPNQTETNPPIAYPFLIRGLTSNCNDILIENIFLYNCFQFADFSMAHQRVAIKNIYGDVLKKGIIIDNCWDVDRIQDIHFWGYFSDGKTTEQQNALSIYRANNSVGITLGKADGIQGDNIFMYGLNIGLLLGIEGRGCYGQITNLSLDICTSGIRALAIGGQGLTINGYEYAMNPTLQIANGTAYTYPIVADYPSGLLQINNINSWGGGSTFLYVTSTFGVSSGIVLNDIQINDLADDQLIVNNGLGKIIVANLRCILNKNLVNSASNASQVIFENPDVFKETYLGLVSPIIKKYADTRLATIPSSFSINIGKSKIIKLTGTATVENIIHSASIGDELTIIVTNSIIFANSLIYNLRLFQQFNATANDTLTLIFDGTNWLEKCRSVNIQ